MSMIRKLKFYQREKNMQKSSSLNRFPLRSSSSGKNIGIRYNWFCIIWNINIMDWTKNYYLCFPMGLFIHYEIICRSSLFFSSYLLRFMNFCNRSFDIRIFSLFSCNFCIFCSHLLLIEGFLCFIELFLRFIWCFTMKYYSIFCDF